MRPWQYQSNGGDRTAVDVRASGTGHGRTVHYGMPDNPRRDTVLRQVREITESLEGALDEGTGAALDRLIGSWTAKWVATVEADYADHCTSISLYRTQAAHRLNQAVRTAQHENERLGQVGSAYLDCSERFEDRPDWSTRHPLADSSRTKLAVAVLLALAAVFIQTVAFRNTLALALPQQSSTLAWLTSTSAASMALAAAVSMGIFLAIPRHRPHSGSGLAAALVAVGWAGLGLASILVPLLGAGAHFTPLAALFSGAVYLLSGVCAVFGAERTYNPGRLAYARLGRQYRQQQKKVAEAEAAVAQARAAVAHLDAELDREDRRRQAAIVERQALGAEAANYARIVMAAMMADPAKTGITETGPDSPSAIALSERTEIPLARADSDGPQ